MMGVVGTMFSILLLPASPELDDDPGRLAVFPSNPQYNFKITLANTSG